MVAYADSSFLVSIYVDDAHTGIARAWFEKNPHPLALTPFSKSEAEHALRLLAFRRVIPEEVMTRCLLTFEQDREDGLYEPLPVEAGTLFQKAAQLSRRHTLILGVRYLDMLHVASALLAKSSRFLTFDQRQSALAKAVGLEVGP